MGWWTDHVVPRITDKTCGLGEIHKLRSRACDGLTGDVLEIGFGSGLNATHYPAEVRRVLAVEPSDVGWRIAGPRIDAMRAPVVRAGLDGQRIDLESSSCDSALSTFTMCTIPDLDAALGELARVLRPGGTLHFVEHGRAPDDRVARWQDRLQPIQGRVAGGCHLNRSIQEYVERSRLRLTDIDTFYVAGPKPFGYCYLGRAVKD